MSQIYPALRIKRKIGTKSGTAGNAISETVTVPSGNFGVVLKLWLDLDSASTADLENGAAAIEVTITIGSSVWTTKVHAFIASTTATKGDYLNLGPWEFDFGPEGFYSGKSGEDIVITVGAPGTGVIARINYWYSGD